MWAHLKKLIYICYVVALLIFTVWYGQFMYPLIFGFSDSKAGAAESIRELAAGGSLNEEILATLMVDKEETQTIDLGNRIIEQPYIPGRFHHIGFDIEKDEHSICIRCHGNVPHDGAKEVRSFLNMHTFYIACETCHIEPEQGKPPFTFRWASIETGEPIPNPKELVDIENGFTIESKSSSDMRKSLSYGNYGAKITPTKIENDQMVFVKRGGMMGIVEHYIANQDKMSASAQASTLNLIHSGARHEPIKCNMFHNPEDQYLPFAELGYPPRWMDELTNTAVVGMITKASEFWIPTLLNPGGSEEEGGDDF